MKHVLADFFGRRQAQQQQLETMRSLLKQLRQTQKQLAYAASQEMNPEKRANLESELAVVKIQRKKGVLHLRALKGN